MKQKERDFEIIALASMTIKAWKEYEKYTKALKENLIGKGFKEDDRNDAEFYISDEIIGNDLDDPVKFEEEVKQYLK